MQFSFYLLVLWSSCSYIIILYKYDGPEQILSLSAQNVNFSLVIMNKAMKPQGNRNQTLGTVSLPYFCTSFVKVHVLSGLPKTQEQQM